jgi:hypothetical protein
MFNAPSPLWLRASGTGAGGRPDIRGGASEPQTCKIVFVLPDPKAKLPFQRPFAKAPCTTGALSAAASAWHSNWQLIRPAPI